MGRVLQPRRPRLRTSLSSLADWLDDRDRELFCVAAAGRHRALDVLMPPLAMGANDTAIWLPLSAVLGVFPGAPRRVAARSLGAFVVASILTDAALKRLTRRPRPPLAELLDGVDGLDGSDLVEAEQPKSASFPSGHAASGMAFAVAAVQEVGWPAAPLLLLGSAICYSRIYTGAHYPGDVAGGTAVGVAVALAADWSWIPNRVVGALAEQVRRRRPGRPSPGTALEP